MDPLDTLNEEIRTHSGCGFEICAATNATVRRKRRENPRFFRGREQEILWLRRLKESTDRAPQHRAVGSIRGTDARAQLLPLSPESADVETHSAAEREPVGDCPFVLQKGGPEHRVRVSGEDERLVDGVCKGRGAESRFLRELRISHREAKRFIEGEPLHLEARLDCVRPCLPRETADHAAANQPAIRVGKKGRVCLAAG